MEREKTRKECKSENAWERSKSSIKMLQVAVILEYGQVVMVWKEILNREWGLSNNPDYLIEPSCKKGLNLTYLLREHRNQSRISKPVATVEEKGYGINLSSPDKPTLRPTESWTRYSSFLMVEKLISPMYFKKQDRESWTYSAKEAGPKVSQSTLCSHFLLLSNSEVKCLPFLLQFYSHSLDI